LLAIINGALVDWRDRCDYVAVLLREDLPPTTRNVEGNNLSFLKDLFRIN